MLSNHGARMSVLISAPFLLSGLLFAQQHLEYPMPGFTPAPNQWEKLKGVESVLIKPTVTDSRDGEPIMPTGKLKEFATKTLAAKGVQVISDEDLQDKIAARVKTQSFESREAFCAVGISVTRLEEAVANRPERQMVFLNLACLPGLRTPTRMPNEPKTNPMGDFWKQGDSFETPSVTKAVKKDVLLRLEKLLGSFAADYFRANPTLKRK